MAAGGTWPKRCCFNDSCDACVYHQSGIQQICFFTAKNESTNLISSFTFQQVVSAIRSGVNPAGTLSNHSSLWDLSSAFFFAGTVITTIGGSNTRMHTHVLCVLRLLSFRFRIEFQVKLRVKGSGCWKYYAWLCLDNIIWIEFSGFSCRFWEHFSAYGRWKDLLHRLRAARHSSLRLPPGGSGRSAGHHLRQRHRQGGENVCGESACLVSLMITEHILL